MAKKTLTERKAAKLAELDKIKKDLARLEAQAAERIGKIAVAAGLADLELDDGTLKKEFEDIAARFRKSQGDQGSAVSPENSSY